MVHLQPGRLGERGVGHGADGDEDEVGAHLGAVGEDGAGPPFVLLEGGERGVEVQVDAVLAVQVGEDARHVLTDRAHEGKGGALDHGDRATCRPGGRRDLEADPAGTDDEQAAAEVLLELLGLLDGAQVGDRHTRLVGHRQVPRGGAGGDEQVVVGDGPAVDLEGAGRGVERRDAGAGDQLDTVVGVPALVLGRGIGGGALAEEDVLGQRRSLVGCVRLGSHEDDVPVVALLAQLGGGAGAGQAGPDDGDGHGVLLVSARNSARLRGSSRSRPKSAEVVVAVPATLAPRSVMQVCSAWTTTPTPRGPSASSRWVAI